MTPRMTTPRKRMRTKHPAIHIVWRDSASYGGGGWPRIEEMVSGLHVLTLESVGYLLHKDKHRVVYAHSLDEENDRANGVGVIPRNCVVSLRILPTSRKGRGR